MTVYAIPTEVLDDFWPAAKTLLTSAVSVAGEVSSDDLYPELKNGNKLLWVAAEGFLEIYGAAVTTVIAYPLKKVLLVEYLSAVPNKMDRFFHQGMDLFTKWAKHHECDTIEVHGRKGWERVLKDYGCKVTRYVCDIKLKG
jgi:hypothetical protein